MRAWVRTCVCVCVFLCLFIVELWVGLISASVAYPDHTHSFLYSLINISIKEIKVHN